MSLLLEGCSTQVSRLRRRQQQEQRWLMARLMTAVKEAVTAEMITLMAVATEMITLMAVAAEMITLMAVLSWESDGDCASITQDMGAMAVDQSWEKEKRWCVTDAPSKTSMADVMHVAVTSAMSRMQ